MRLPVAALAVTAALATACGSSSSPTPRAAATPSSSPSASPSPTASPPAGALTSARLGTALIAVADLPKGYTKDAKTLGTSLAVSTTDDKCARGFAGVNTVQKTGPLAVYSEARVSFSKGTAGPFLRDSISSYASHAKAASFLAAAHSVFRQCPSFQVTNPTTHRVTAVRLTPLTFPRIGDEGVSVTAQLATMNGPAVRMLLVFVRKGQSVVYIAELASDAADTALLEKAVRAQVAKLAKA